MNQTPKTILAFDLDGTLVPRNHFEIHPRGLSNLLEDLNNLGHISIPVTGKPAKYASNIFPINKLSNNGIIAENAGVYTLPHTTKVENSWFIYSRNEKVKRNCGCWYGQC